MAGFRPNDAQLSAIQEKGKHILVSAGAGSGKTTVLVERILREILEEQVDIDDLIVVTFTRAAAAHMKEKIHARIRAALEDDTLSEEKKTHLKSQLMKVFGARICTLDSLCMDIVREHFQSVDIDPGFRIAEEAEITLLKQDVLAAMIEAHYAEPTEEFLHFVSYYTDKNDSRLEDIILAMYRFSQSHPDPEEWLINSVKPYQKAEREGAAGAPEDDPGETGWIREFHRFSDLEFKDLAFRAEKGIRICDMDDGPFAYRERFEQLYAALSVLSGRSFPEKRSGIRALEDQWTRLPAIRKNDEVSYERKESARDLYASIKKDLGKLKDRFFFQSLGEMLADMKACAGVAETICSLTLEFSRRLSEEKKVRMIADFNDIAHFALSVLTEKDESGGRRFTAAADHIAKTTKEIIMDEYQDTNRMQDALIDALSAERFGRPNVFMVGDVKQSIYGFRLACPELFLEKYNAFTDPEGQGKRIILGENYRSRKEVVDFINLVFDKIMLPEVGGIDYLDGNRMEAGALFPEPEEGMPEDAFLPEILFVAGSGNAGRDAESYLIARKIEELTASHYITGEDGKLRKIRYSDIAILTRTSNHPRLEKMLTDRYIPVQKSSGKGFFSAFEIRLAIDLMKTVDNPLQDIPLAAVLISPLTGLKAEALARIKAAYQKEPFCLYKACLSYMESRKDPVSDALRDFFEKLSFWREQAEDLGICRFLDELLEGSGLSGCCRAMTYGDGRAANLAFLKGLAESFSGGSYTGLFHFIRYLDAVQKAGQDFGSGKTGGGEDAVTMMTIHKSKGLEFPVVILADAGKEITDQDAAGPVYTDDELGLGIEQRDVESRIRKRTLLMETIAMKRKAGLMAEEIRLLYVAMSRAKEKLIITGFNRYLSSRREKWDQEGTAFSPDPGTILSDNSYMYLLADAMRSAPAKEQSGFSWRIFDAEEIEIERAYEVFDEQKKRAAIEEAIRMAEEGPFAAGGADPGSEESCVTGETASDPREEKKKASAGIYAYDYPYRSAALTNVKFTASQMEQYDPGRSLRGEDAGPLRRMEEKDAGPRREGGEILTGAERGSAFHRLFELIDLKAADRLLSGEGEASAEAFAAEQIEMLRAGGYFRPEEANALEPERIALFLLSDLGKRMRRAEREGTLRREQQFVMSAEIGGNPEGLMQGIIDAFFFEGEGKEKHIVLVDYKTDRGRSGEEMIRIYQGQQEQYAKALERATGLPVAEKILYAVETGTAIRLP